MNIKNSRMNYFLHEDGQLKQETPLLIIYQRVRLNLVKLNYLKQ